MLGKLKHSLKEKCPQCKRVLQLRVFNIPKIEKGIEVIEKKEYIVCSNSEECSYEREVEQKRKRKSKKDTNE